MHASAAELPATTASIVVGADTKEVGEPESGEPAPRRSAEVDDAGRPYLGGEKWQKMGGTDGNQPGLLDRVFTGLYGDLPVEDRLRVAWLAGTLFFIIGG